MEDHRRPQDQQQLEQELLEHIAAAARRYSSAKAQTKIVQEQYPDLPLGHVDGNLARRKVAANEAMSLEKYRQAVNTFTDLVIYGRVPAADAQAHPLTVDVLTPRETEVLKLIAEGLSTKQIAAQLGISFKTAASHRSRLMEKLDIHDVARLVRYAIRKKLIEP